MAINPQQGLRPEQRRALRLIARSPHGCTESAMLALGFKIEMLAMLVIDGLATAQPETVGAGRRQKKAVRVQITDAGRRALVT